MVMVLNTNTVVHIPNVDKIGVVCGDDYKNCYMIQLSELKKIGSGRYEMKIISLEEKDFVVIGEL